jgi:hypothetical protein
MNNADNNMSAASIITPTAGFRAQATDTLAKKLRTVWLVLKVTFSIVPIVAGLDKFTNLLANWEEYLNPMMAHVIPLSPHVFMEIAGVIEIVAGIVVFYRPRLGALIVAAWLTSIALSLLASGHYLDVAVRDLVMAVAAFALAELTPIVESYNDRQ